METGHELFIHEMRDMLDAERHLVKALDENAADSSRPDLQAAFRRHARETEDHVERLEQCFQLLDEHPHATECRGIRGLIEEKKSFAAEDPSHDLIDVFNIGAGIKAETYEICAYTSLIEMAREMKHTDAARLLSQNLKDEKAALRKMEMFHRKVKPAQMMSEEQSAALQSERRQRTSRSRNRSSHSKRAA